MWLLCLFWQDVSRLLDLSRQSIVFDSSVDIAACIRAVREDSDAHVVRIKNKLDPSFDAGPYGGYRDVAVNLRLTTPAAICLGLESHVCELQLLLRPFAEFKVVLHTALPVPIPPITGPLPRYETHYPDYPLAANCTTNTLNCKRLTSMM